MADTVSNQGKTVVHQGSSHKAITGSDTCFIPGMVPVTFPNEAPASTLGAGKSTNTFIQNNPIALLRTHIGPESNQAHAGVVGGVAGPAAPYRQEAQATSASSDVFVEGDAVVRTGDPTTNNHKNTSGSIVGGSLVDAAEVVAEKPKKKCHITLFQGFVGDTPLGYPKKGGKGDPYYLEVFDDEVVTFVTERIDVTSGDHEQNPKCEKANPPHTSWDARALKFPRKMTESVIDTEHGVELFELPASMAIEDWFYLLDLGTQNPIPEDRKSPQQDDRFRLREDKRFGEDDFKDLGTDLFKSGKSGIAGRRLSKPRLERAKQMAKDAYDKKKSAAKAKKDAREVLPKDLRTLLLWMWWALNAPEITVTARGCSGVRNATIKVFPRDRLVFEVTPVFLKKFQSWSQSKAKAAGAKAQEVGSKVGGALQSGGSHALTRMREEGDKRWKDQMEAGRAALEKAQEGYDAAMAQFNGAVKWIQSVAGGLQMTQNILTTVKSIAEKAKAPLQVKFLEGFHIRFTLEFLRTKDQWNYWKTREFTSAQLGLKYSVSVGASPLIGVSYKQYFSLLVFLNAFLPGATALLRRFRIVRVDIFLKVEINLKLRIGLEKDEHDTPGGFSNVDTNFTPSMGIAAGGAGIDVLEFSVGLPIRGRLKFYGAVRPGQIITMTPQVDITNYYRLVLFPDRWWEIEAAEGSIRSLFYSWKGKEQTLLKNPS